MCEYKVIHLPGKTPYFGFVTDIHLSDRPPGRRVDAYRSAIMGKLRFVNQWLRDQGTKYDASPLCLCGGDVFHVKNPESLANKNHLVTEAMAVFKSFPQGAVHGIVGNHDVQFDNHTTINNQPLGLMIYGGAYVPIDGPVIYRCQDIDVEVWGFKADSEMEVLDAILEASKAPRQAEYRIGIAHAMARPGGAQNLFGHPTIGYDLMEGIDFDVMLWGHDHSWVETQEVGNCLHIHPGSLARASLAYDEVERDPMVVGLHFGEELTISHKKIPVNPLEVAFRVADKAVVEAGKSAEIQEYTVSTKSMGSIETLDAQAVVTEIVGEDQPLMTLINDVCEW